MVFLLSTLVELPDHMAVWTQRTQDTFLSPALQSYPLVSEQQLRVWFGLDVVLVSLCTMQLSAAVTFTFGKGQDSVILMKNLISSMCKWQIQDCILSS